MTAFLALLAGLRSRLAAWAAAAGAAVAALAYAYLAGRRTGRAVAEARQAKAAQEQARERADADMRAGRAGDPVGELRRDWRRP